jgi:hypothetical protein
MIVTVSVFKSPPWSPTLECMAMSSLSSTRVKYKLKDERASVQVTRYKIVHTGSTIDDAMVRPEDPLEQFGYRPSDDSL